MRSAYGWFVFRQADGSPLSFSEWVVMSPQSAGLMLLGVLLLALSMLGAYVDGRRSRSKRR